MEAPGPTGPGWRAPRRIATTPISLHSRHEAASQSSALVETLYYHPNIKIVSFTASARAISRSPTRGSDGVDKEEVGTLSWSSQIERTIAVGPFRIYRAPASVAFLNCGSALQPILPKSQSWCLDEVNSRFVLQIRRPNYWRLELSVDSAEDQKLAHELRGVLDNILQFEKTPCPFKRTFTVHLPEPPQEPVKKKPWKPVRRSLPDMTVSPTTPTGRPIDAAIIHTLPTVERTFDDSASTSSLGSNTRESSPARASSLGRSAGLALLAQKTRAVSEGAPTVPSLVKQFDQRSEHKPPSVAQSEDQIADSAAPEENDLPEVTPLQTELPEDTHETKPELVNEPILTEKDNTDLSNAQDEGSSADEQQPAPSIEASDLQEIASEVASPSLEIHVGAGRQSAQRKVRLRRSTGFGSIRLSTPVRPLSINTAPPPLDTTVPAASPEESGNISPTESEDSFHSVESWHADDTILPPSPPASQSDAKAQLEQPPDDASDNESDTSDDSAATAPDDTVSIPEEQDVQSLAEETDRASVASAPLETERTRPKHRQPISDGSLRRRALSPLAPAANIFSPPAPAGASRALIYNNRLEIMKKLPMAIISKTCSIVLGPPLHLLTLMLKVAAKIAAGQWRGQEYGYGTDGEQIPVHWDYSDGDISDWDEDVTSPVSHPRNH